ncbi:MAG: hypothetical protein U0361_20640 [Nitrospiraceae bacterium]
MALGVLQIAFFGHQVADVDIALRDDAVERRDDGLEANERFDVADLLPCGTLALRRGHWTFMFCSCT